MNAIVTTIPSWNILRNSLLAKIQYAKATPNTMYRTNNIAVMKEVAGTIASGETMQTVYTQSASMTLTHGFFSQDQSLFEMQ